MMPWPAAPERGGSFHKLCGFSPPLALAPTMRLESPATRDAGASYLAAGMLQHAQKFLRTLYGPQHITKPAQEHKLSDAFYNSTANTLNHRHKYNNKNCNTKR